MPYGGRLVDLSATGSYAGSNILTVGGVRAGDPPSWNAAVSFTLAYAAAVWKALVTALLISAAIQVMCTCCTAPVVATLRRTGVRTAAVVAYWLGNPLLNPAVLAFLAVVAPWQWTFTRLVVGLVLVVGGAALVARLTGDERADDDTTRALAGPDGDEPVVDRVDSAWLRRTAVAYLRALARLTIVLVPEYLVVVMLVGAFRGWLFPIAGAGSGLLVVVLAAVVGTLVVIPTAGEIPILQGLAVAGLAAGPVGALLLTLPAVSLPGIAMVGRAFGWRVTAATTAVVMVGGVVAGGALALLT